MDWLRMLMMNYNSPSLEGGSPKHQTSWSLEQKNYHDPSWAMSKTSRAENIIYCIITHWLSFLSSCIFRGIIYSSCSKDFAQNVYYSFLSRGYVFPWLVILHNSFWHENFYEKNDSNEKAQKIILQYLSLWSNFSLICLLVHKPLRT